jgi:hypothetical protein
MAKRRTGAASSEFTEEMWRDCLSGPYSADFTWPFVSLQEGGCLGFTERKVQLFQVACARRVTPLIRNKLVLKTIELAEEAADAPSGLRSVLPLATHDSITSEMSKRQTDSLAEYSLHLGADLADPNPLGVRLGGLGNWAMWVAAHAKGKPNDASERTPQAVFVQDIFGNPFRPVTLDPVWLTSTVTALARGMYESRDFSGMPILADALQDAGCDSADILDHCRDPKQVHARGCWVVDLVLGKA